ncbi:ubiquinone/menaquinone biosynthesis C-methylase UbiE [Nocardioides daedukensis]|uniref:Ubiquinone/menaquinone biosynthesis C-methylase UbiE n=1 Tax=Nocardioides daedukensis TaxID=634462 RepID=A0A7Y9UTH6_9ACTN|nr:class I SAM-dependent methyltransferase [Nocardioides daedukensis]NYG58244.1 ubiquinone/menaquinone biosynthesis C-methylase UbiE [Nocardioides daedukensis]
MTGTDPIQTQLNEYWTLRAPDYDAYQQSPGRLEANNRAWGEVFASALPAAPADVLDLGTGSGYVACLLAGQGHRVTATDLSAGMLEQAEKHAVDMDSPPTFLEGDAVAPDFPPASFDAITNRFLMWTMRETDRALSNWRRLLRPGGTLAVVDGTWYPHGMEHDTTEEFQRLYDASVQQALPLATASSIDMVADRVVAAGFREVEVTPLQTLLDLDRKYGVAPNHEVVLLHVVTGRV